MKNKLNFLIVMVLMSGGMAAQTWFGTSYSTAYPVGDFKDYMGKSSFRGFGFEYKSYVTKNIAFGVNNSYNFFNQFLDKASYTYETLTATGVQRRHTSAIPMMATFDVGGTISGPARWFAGAGIGTTYLYRYTDFGMFTFSRETWQFLIAPEVGVWIPVVYDNVLYLTARYNINFKNDELVGQQFISLNLGWAWSWGKEKE